MDEHAVDPVSVHVDDFETVPFSFEDVTGARNTAEYRDRKTAQCVVVLTLRAGEQMLRLEQVLDCIYLESTIDQPTPVFRSDNRWLITRCARRLAHDGGDDVRHADGPLHPAELVDNQRHPQTGA